MSDVVYVSKSRIELRQGPLRIAHLPGPLRRVVARPVVPASLAVKSSEICIID
jgi:hypothetical protein